MASSDERQRRGQREGKGRAARVAKVVGKVAWGTVKVAAKGAWWIARTSYRAGKRAAEREGERRRKREGRRD
jgi:hypothetical protein